MSLTLTEAKAHVRDCIERDDVEGLQKLLENPESFLRIPDSYLSGPGMRSIVEKLTNDWPKLQAQAAKRREFERLRKLDEPRERELEKLYANRKSFMSDEPVAITLKPLLFRVHVVDDLVNPKRVRNLTVHGSSSAKGAIDKAIHLAAYEDFQKEFPLCSIAKVEFAGILDSL